MSAILDLHYLTRTSKEFAAYFRNPGQIVCLASAKCRYPEALLATLRVLPAKEGDAYLLLYHRKMKSYLLLRYTRNAWFSFFAVDPDGLLSDCLALGFEWPQINNLIEEAQLAVFRNPTRTEIDCLAAVVAKALAAPSNVLLSNSGLGRFRTLAA